MVCVYGSGCLVQCRVLAAFLASVPYITCQMRQAKRSPDFTKFSCRAISPQVEKRCSVGSELQAACARARVPKEACLSYVCIFKSNKLTRCSVKYILLYLDSFITAKPQINLVLYDKVGRMSKTELLHISLAR